MVAPHPAARLSIKIIGNAFRRVTYTGGSAGADRKNDLVVRPASGARHGVIPS